LRLHHTTNSANFHSYITMGNNEITYQWVARDKSGELWCYDEKPYRLNNVWKCGGSRKKIEGLVGEPYCSLRWEDDVINVNDVERARKAEKQNMLDERYIKMARIWAENSYCKRRQVGALLVKDNMIISDGYNGTPSGFENDCETPENTSKTYVLHAEANAITKVAKSCNSSDGATLYVTASPCVECAKLIIQSGIRRVVYSEEYRLTDGIDLLRRANIIVEYKPI